jgi:hypothetical protein
MINKQFFFRHALLGSIFSLMTIVAIAQLPRLDAKGKLVDMNEVDISLMVQHVPAANQFIDTAYNIWCGSVIKAENGKYYMFYSRWPKSEGHGAWITHSEIALARADRPEGPYKHLKVVFKARGNQYWDGVCTHNPAAIVHNGKYYLYYMGATGNAEIKKGFDYSPAWYNYRNNQRIGVAVANDPEGEWNRFDKPVLDVSKDSAAYDAMMVSNPAITVDQNGRAILVYKQVEKNGTYRGGRVRYGVAFSKSIMGPFTKHPQPIFEDKQNPNAKEWMIAEDPFIWNHKGTNYAIVRDVIGKFTGSAGGLALFSSKDAIQWNPAKYPKVISKDVFGENEKKFDDKLERPCLLMENGLPIYLFGAMGIEKRKHSMNIAVPLKANAMSTNVKAQSLEDLFLHPPGSSRPYVWWHWMGPNFSKYGITKDLEAMKAMGIGGATIFNITSAVQETHRPILNNPWPDQVYRGDAYWDAMKHAAAEAKRLGLELGLHNTAGYSTTGGPWVDQPKAMQTLVWTVQEVVGGEDKSLRLEKPVLPIYKGWGANNAQASFYKDIAVIAYPQASVLQSNQAIELTHQMDSTGILNWKVPAGKWYVYRMGHAPTMANPHPLPDDIIGKSLEVDKMDAALNRFHWNTVFDPMKKHLQPYLGNTFKHVLIDSYEAGGQNWTAGFRDAFKQIKGYDPVPFLFTLGSKSSQNPMTVLNSENETKRFKWDFNDVVNRLFFDNGWKIGKSMINGLGMELQFEAYGGPFDDVEGAALAGLPMGEFWTSKGGVNANIGAAARAAGKHLVGAEAFTGAPGVSQYTEDPAFLMQTVNSGFAAGVNRLVLHTWVHQPFDDKYQPGMGMGWWGTHFSRFQTWFEPGKAFFNYLTRTQTLLQYGQQKVDYLCLGKSNGYNTDAISMRDFISQDIKVVNGKIQLPSGRSYPFFKLPAQDNIEVEVLEKIAALVNEGAVVVGKAPTASLGLHNWAENDLRVKSLARMIWREEGVSVFGKGKVYVDIKQAEKDFHPIKDYEITNADSTAAIKVVHRVGAMGDIYHVSNNQNRTEYFDLFLQQKGLQPEFWQAEDGSMKDAAHWSVDENGTMLPMKLNPYQSIFIVFRKNSTGLISKRPLPSSQLEALHLAAPKTLQPLTGKWNLLMKPKMDSSFNIAMDGLQYFGTHAENRIKYFAGTATYSKKFVFENSGTHQGKTVVLDLGELHDIVQVSLDGKDLGVKWYPPYQYDISTLVGTGEHLLKISVTNNWANRLIGDEQEPADFEWGADRKDFGNAGRPMKSFPDWFIRNEPRPSQGRKAFTLWYYYKQDSPLKPAGLLGPVNIIYSDNIAVQ